MMWRPEGWNPVKHYIRMAQQGGDHDLFEAGADAMLEALKKQGLRWQDGHSPSFKDLGEFMESWPENGWLVFIPEEPC